jgi:hypothetical protein
MITQIHYNIQDCGDGSVRLDLYESKELAEITEKYMDPGWGEPCFGSILIEHDSPIKIKSRVYTIDDCIKYVNERISWYSDQNFNYLKIHYQRELDELNSLKDSQK